MSKEHIIDIEKKGNVVRFYLGTGDDYWGDDWDDAPYEHNAGCVYNEFVTRIIDIAFPYDYIVTEASDDWTYRSNSPFCKEDMKKREVPCLIVISPEIAEDECFPSFHLYKDRDDAVRFFFNDPVETLFRIPTAIILLDERKEVVS